MDFPGGSNGEESACNEGDLGLISGSGRSPGEGNGNPLQYSCPEKSMDREVWQTGPTVERVRQDWATSTFTFNFHRMSYKQILSNLSQCPV